jgi:hypothetical protein
LFQENKWVELKFEARRKIELLALEKYDVYGKVETVIVRNEYPEHPVHRFKVTEGFDYKKAREV